MMVASKSKSTMHLRQLLEGMVSIPSILDCEITDLTMDSRQVETGKLFLAVRGQSVNGVDYIDDAIARGAAAIVCDTAANDESVSPVSWKTSEADRKVPVIAVEGLSKRAGEIADRFYGSPSSRLFVAGITGTNGKTSCSQFVAQALQQDEICGVIGTLGTGLYGKLQHSGHTTPDVISNHRCCAQMRDNGASSVMMEVSSHALDQGRVDGIHFDCAVFTNLSHEHLDYHGDMESYAAVKRKLFEAPDLAAAVINSDEDYGRDLLTTIDPSIRVISYGFQSEYSPMLLAYDIQMDSTGMRFGVKSSFGNGTVRTTLLGRFNVGNLLAALGVLLIKGLEFNEAIARLSNISTVSGRMERLGGGELPLVVIDYAHTPDALQHVLAALREHTQGILWCVFGCGGDRDKQKRPLMGRIAEQYADRIYITDDNPRYEDPLDIIEHIQAGMKHADKAYVERDRRKAIETAIQGAATNDVILIAGKGHENYQQIGDQKCPFSDLAEARLQLKMRKS